METIYADLHIHIGRTKSGRPVKITGSKNLTFQNILEHASEQKGLQMIGIIDCHAPEVLVEIEGLLKEGVVRELAGGGLRYKSTTIILGTEIEVYDAFCKGPIHILAYFPTIQQMQAFSRWMSAHVKNMNLSTQRIYVTGRELQQKVYEHVGLFIPAHVFTPFKSLYGKGVEHRLTEVFDPEKIDAIELGLSSDTTMVSDIEEIQRYPFLTNSDAHSLGKIAREYERMELKEANFEELKMALRGEQGRAITANFGLNPLLGKYYESVCGHCGEHVVLNECATCGSKSVIKGVAKRIEELSTKGTGVHSIKPPYIHQVPLDFIPGLGPKTFERLLAVFGTEMQILHSATLKQLAEVVPEKLAVLIDLARKGEITIAHGGGGKYGKVKTDGM